MKIKKAIITAAGRNQRALPLQTLVDVDGVTKSALRVVVDEVVSAGVEEVCVVTVPGDREAYQRAAGEQVGRLCFVEQAEPRGYGHALYAAKDFVAGENFLHLVSDHLPISRTKERCAQQLVRTATAENCAVSAVQPTRENMLPHFGTIGGRRVPEARNLYEVETVVEKPTPTEAEQSLIVPGLRSGHYLCFFGMHVLTPGVMEILGELTREGAGEQRIQLSTALNALAGRERYVALQVEGNRYDIGGKYGLFYAQLALALEGTERDEVLTQLVEMLATRQRRV
ncbi:MAG TPA: sugar phosphate nucleotidyltransferase [Tepidisphaeraceae bacterium]|jgi:UTP--glucose-1-phosphate uridylyltransferase